MQVAVYYRKRRMRERLRYLSGIDSSLHNGEVVLVQNGVHVRDLPSEDSANNKTHNIKYGLSPFITENQC